MRKVFLLTTVLLAFAGTAQATPVAVNLGGSVDFRAALYNESSKENASVAGHARRGGFQTVYNINITAEGKTDSVEYGALINLSNEPPFTITTATMQKAYVWISGAYGKVIAGDHRGVFDSVVIAPTVGLDQIDGAYFDYTSALDLADMRPLYREQIQRQDTKITYYTPKFGNENHKVQLGIGFTPDRHGWGSAVALYDSAYDYKNTTEAVLVYEGRFDKVDVKVTPMIVLSDGIGSKTAVNNSMRDYTQWGVGAETVYTNFTLGGSFVNMGHANTAVGQNRDQHIWTLGLKYDGIKDVDLAVNYLTGKGYYNFNDGRFYVDSYDALGFGAVYNWAPGMATSADAVFFNQNRANTGRNILGHMFMLSQKMSF